MLPVLAIIALLAAQATYNQTDVTTQGTWTGVYGRGGYVIAGDTTQLPPDVHVTLSGQTLWTWPTSTDPRALQRATGTDRVMAAWYGTTFTIDVTITGAARPVAIYAADYDHLDRAQRYDLVDDTGTVVETRTLSTFTGGTYVVWTVQGHLTIRVTSLAGQNAVVSGVFVGPAADIPDPTEPPATAVRNVFDITFAQLDAQTNPALQFDVILRTPAGAVVWTERWSTDLAMAGLGEYNLRVEPNGDWRAWQLPAPTTAGTYVLEIRAVRRDRTYAVPPPDCAWPKAACGPIETWASSPVITQAFTWPLGGALPPRPRAPGQPILRQQP